MQKNKWKKKREETFSIVSTYKLANWCQYPKKWVRNNWTTALRWMIITFINTYIVYLTNYKYFDAIFEKLNGYLNDVYA